MDKVSIAREARALAVQLRYMRIAPEEELANLLDDVRARIDFALDSTLDAVLQAGIHALGRVPQSIVRKVAAEREAPGFVSTTCWRQQVDILLDHCSEHMAWRDRTFVTKLRSRGMLISSEVARLEQICTTTFSAANLPTVFDVEEEDEVE